MSLLLFRLRNVPEDEAQEVRALLSDHQLDFYETDAGNWGISMPGIWLKDEARADEARALLAEYQAERRVQARQEYSEMRAQGEHRTLLDSLREQPLRFMGYSAVIVVVMYISVSVFFSLGN